jgi:hypothetical protein
LIYRVLLLVIGIELVRTLVTHELRAILELLAFVVARKMLKPDLAFLDILLSVLAFVALLAANRFLLPTSLPPALSVIPCIECTLQSWRFNTCRSP